VLIFSELVFNTMTTTIARRTTKSRPRVLRQALQEHTRAAYREAILTAAERIILRDGYQPAKMADIADATGVSVGTLYNYFDSKEAVLNALLEHHRARFQAQIEQSFESDDPLVQIRQIIARAHDFAEQNGALFNLYVRTAGNGHNSHNGSSTCVVQESDYERFSLMLTEMLNRGVQQGRIRSDIPVTKLVWALHAMMQSLLLDWCRKPDGLSLKQRGDELVTLFFEGASTR
jgi:AcrR family transcriptional regulator